MMRHWQIVVMSGIAAFLLPMDGHAQQDGTSRNRLMFDPAGMQGPRSRVVQPEPSPTTGQSTTSRQSTQTAPPAAPQRSAAPAAKPAAEPAAATKPAARNTARAPARTASPRQPARTENANNASPPANARSSDRPVPREQPTALGRVDLPSGSLGFENRTALRDYDMSDGRKVPGFDNIQRNESSYFGLSIRMPTPSSSPSWMRHGVD